MNIDPFGLGMGHCNVLGIRQGNFLNIKDISRIA